MRRLRSDAHCSTVQGRAQGYVLMASPTRSVARVAACRSANRSAATAARLTARLITEMAIAAPPFPCCASLKMKVATVSTGEDASAKQRRQHQRERPGQRDTLLLPAR